MQLYKLIRNEKSELYYRFHSRYDFWPGDSESIFLLMDEATGYAMSNSNRLFLEVFLGQGVSEEDYQNDSAYLLLYLRYLECYYEEVPWEERL